MPPPAGPAILGPAHVARLTPDRPSIRVVRSHPRPERPASPSLLTALALTAAPRPLKDPPQPAPPVVGEWLAKRRTFAGNEQPIAGRPLRYVFTTDGKWEVYRDRDKLPGDQRYKADPSRHPAAIDLDTGGTEPDLTAASPPASTRWRATP